VPLKKELVNRQIQKHLAQEGLTEIKKSFERECPTLACKDEEMEDEDTPGDVDEEQLKSIFEEVCRGEVKSLEAWLKDNATKLSAN